MILHLVDAQGYDVPVTEKNAVPVDPADANDWPAWTDDWFWETGPDVDPEPTAAERAELESWLASLDGDYPPADQADDDDWPASLPVEPLPDRLNVESFRNIADIIGRCR
jgi:hypothetical protein